MLFGYTQTKLSNRINNQIKMTQTSETSIEEMREQHLLVFTYGVRKIRNTKFLVLFSVVRQKKHWLKREIVM